MRAVCKTVGYVVSCFYINGELSYTYGGIQPFVLFRSSQ